MFAQEPQCTTWPLEITVSRDWSGAMLATSCMRQLNVRIRIPWVVFRAIGKRVSLAISGIQVNPKTRMRKSRPRTGMSMTQIEGCRRMRFTGRQILGTFSTRRNIESVSGSQLFRVGINFSFPRSLYLQTESRYEHCPSRWALIENECSFFGRIFSCEIPLS